MLTLEGFNILNIKAFKAMEGFIHYTGTGSPAQYYRKMHLVLLPKGPDTQRRIHFLANIDPHRQYKDYKECLTRLSLLHSILKQDQRDASFAQRKYWYQSTYQLFTVDSRFQYLCHELIKADIRRRQQRMIGLIVIYRIL